MRRLIELYRIPEGYVRACGHSELPSREGFFTFGKGTVCFGSCSGTNVTPAVGDSLSDVEHLVRFLGDALEFPFDPDQLVDNLLLERYPIATRSAVHQTFLKSVYYTLRPLMPFPLRSHLQRFYFSRWQEIPFPRWPVDHTVECIREKCLTLLMAAQRIEAVPFIWFWPDGYDSCAIVTHDVETERGMRFCSTLMDIDESMGVKASFQIVPERRYAVPHALLSEIRNRGFEINVQDLYHDGHLLRNEKQFMQRVRTVNRYGKEFGAKGFRTAVLYRNLRWWHALDFAYDMSVPNVAHLDPQRGGCCTVFPYFIGDLLEIPSTTTQDYALFHFLRDYSLTLWEQQTHLIRQKHGLISVLVHPDYIVEQRERRVYMQLLRFLNRLRAEHNVWIATPDQVNEWWRTRSALSLVQGGAGWTLNGSGHERASVAYAHLDGGTVHYQIAGTGALATPLPPRPYR